MMDISEKYFEARIEAALLAGSPDPADGRLLAERRAAPGSAQPSAVRQL